MQPTYDQTDPTSPAGSIPHWIDPVREADLVARRRTVHRTPETGWAEFIATARAAEFFTSLCFKVMVGREFIDPIYVRGRSDAEVSESERLAKAAGLEKVYVHGFLDGRDTDPHDGKGFLADLQAKLDEYGMRGDVTRIEFADTEQIAFLYQDRISVLLGTLNDLDYKLDRARYVLTNADGKGCGPTDTGRLDFSHTSASSTRKIYFAQGEPTLPSGYVVPPKAEEPAPAENTADSTDSAESTDTADTTEPAAETDTEQLPLTHPDRMTANEEENPM